MYSETKFMRMRMCEETSFEQPYFLHSCFESPQVTPLSVSFSRVNRLPSPLGDFYYEPQTPSYTLQSNSLNWFFRTFSLANNHHEQREKNKFSPVASVVTKV